MSYNAKGGGWDCFNGRLVGGALRSTVGAFLLFTLLVCYHSAHGQCTDLKGKVFTIPNEDTVVFTGASLVGNEAKGYDSMNFQMRKDDSQHNLRYTGFKVWSLRFGTDITVVAEDYTKGIRTLVFSRMYLQNGELAKSCTDSIKFFFETPNDQRFDSLQTNSLTIGTGAGSIMFTDFNQGLFRIKDWDYPIFDFSSLWISGLDGAGKAHFSGQFYATSGSSPYNSYTGPARLSNNIAKSFYEKVWSLSPDDLNYNWRFADYPLQYTNNNSVQEPWARYVDQNGNGFFDYKNDYPCLLGDRMLFTSYHHAEDSNSLGSTEIPVDIKQYIFVLEDTAFADVAFMRFEVISYSNRSFDSVMIGLNSNLNPSPVTCKMGCDTNLNMFYSYGDGTVQSNTAINKAQSITPSIGVVYLNQQMTHYMPYHKDFSVCSGGWPSSDEGYRTLMQSKDKLGNPYLYGEPLCGGDSVGTVSKLLFPGNPLDTTAAGGWHMENDATAHEYYYAVGSHGPFQLMPKDTLVFDMALVVAYNGKRSRLENVSALKAKVAQVRQRYAQSGFTCFESNSLGQVEAPTLNFEVYPNPSSGWIRISAGAKGSLWLKDASGKALRHWQLQAEEGQVFNIQNIAPGFYWIEFEAKGQRSLQKLIITKP